MLPAAPAAAPVLASEFRITHTFPRRYRVSRREGFSDILRQPQVVRSWFSIHCKANALGHPRLGIAISKRIIPLATQRNSVKRMIREAFRTAVHRVAFDIVIRVRKPLKNGDYSSAKMALDALLNSVLAPI